MSWTVKSNGELKQLGFKGICKLCYSLPLWSTEYVEVLYGNKDSDFSAY